MNSKRVYLIATLALLGSILFYLIRFTSLFKSREYATDVLNAAFAEQPVGYFNRADSLGVANPQLQHISIQLHTNTPDAQLLAVLKNPDPNAELLITVIIGEKDALEMVADGDFDDALRSLCRVLPKAKRIYLRWNPDMEVPVKRYSWQYQAPADYIRAFRHFAKTCREEAPSAQIMWSPAGYPGTEEYWPGDDVTDVIAIAVNGQSELNATAFPPEPDLRSALRRKIIRTRFINKPVWVLASGTDSLVRSIQSDLKAVTAELKRDSSWIFQEYHIRQPVSRNAGITPMVGVYDPNHILTSSKDVQVEHLFVDLGNIQSGAFARDFEAVVRRGHQVIVSVEPWRDSRVRKDSSVLQNTLQGVYDEDFRALFKTISETSQLVYVRFAHEMEIPIHRYAWQSQDPVLYIKAFRHFMDLGKGIKNIRKVWGPAGDRGSMEWYPGGDVVDFVSIAIYGLPDKNITDPTRQESFETIFNRKMWRMRFASKPVFITEFGVKGPEGYQSEWMVNAARILAAHKEVAGVCYFNLADNPKVWGNIPAPDWGISKVTFDHFIKTLQESD
jgi:beta-mannanase